MRKRELTEDVRHQLFYNGENNDYLDKTVSNSKYTQQAELKGKTPYCVPVNIFRH